MQASGKGLARLKWKPGGFHFFYLAKDFDAGSINNSQDEKR
jgi:hypothetical protein